MDDLVLTKEELQILKVLMSHQGLYIGDRELWGYFKFYHGMDRIQTMIYNLKEAKLIGAHETPAFGFFITEKGKKHLLFLGKQRRSKIAKGFWWALGAFVMALLGAVANKFIGLI